MCLSIPSRVLRTDGTTATVECFGEQREVSLVLMAENVAPGDFLLVQAGGFAYQRVKPEAAEASLKLIAEVLAEPGSATSDPVPVPSP